MAIDHAKVMDGLPFIQSTVNAINQRPGAKSPGRCHILLY